MNLIIKLISLWFILQLFQYQYLSPSLNWNFIVRISPDRLLFIVIVTIFFIKLFRKKIELLPIGRIEFCMIIFAIICTTSYVISIPDVGIDKNRWLTTLFNLVYFPFITYFIIKNIPYSRQRLKIILVTLCIIGVYLTFTGILEHFKVNALVWPKYILDPGVGIHLGRVRGPFVQSDIMGRFLIITFLCTLVLTVYAKETVRNFFLYILMVLMAVVIYFTYTRGNWIGLGIVLLVMIFPRTKMRAPAISILLILVCGFVLGVGSKFTYFSGTLFSKRQTSYDNRVVAMDIGINMVKKNPVFGIGYGRFDSEWNNYFKKVKGIDFFAWDGNHNTFLGILAEVGIIGFVFYMAIFYYMIKMCLKTYRMLDQSQDIEKGIVLVSIAIVAAYIVTVQFIDLRFLQILNNSLFLFLGIVSRLSAEAETPALRGEI